ncbi:hypothetical protein BGX31_009721, partial [Mortierella sp. GBA43]
MLQVLGNSSEIDQSKEYIATLNKPAESQTGKSRKLAKKLPAMQSSSSGPSSESSDSDYPEAKSRKVQITDYLDGDRESIEVEVSGEHCILEGSNLDLTRKLMEKRKELVKTQSTPKQSHNVSIRLALNYIFEDKYLRMINMTNSILRSVFPQTIFEYAGQDDVDREFISRFADMAGKNIPYADIKRVFDEYDTKSMPAELSVDGDDSERLEPDHFGEIEGLAVEMAEIKQADCSARKKSEDRGKLFHMVKLSLNRLLKHGMSDPTVLGILVQDDRIAFYTMNLKYKALYFL